MPALDVSLAVSALTDGDVKPPHPGAPHNLFLKLLGGALELHCTALRRL